MVPVLQQKLAVLLAPASQTAAATRSAVVDTLGADFATIKVNCAAEVNTSASTPTIALTEADENAASSYATWSSSASRNEDLAAAHQVTFHIDTRSRKRYIKLLITAATHTTNDVITVAADSILSKQERVAAGTAAMLGSTNDAVVVL
jgi:hypothetical protein